MPDSDGIEPTVQSTSGETFGAWKKSKIATKQSIKSAAVIAAVAGMITFGAPAQAEMPFDPSSTDFTHNVFTLTESSESSHAPSYIILYDVNKSTGALTEKYYDFSLNRTNYTYQTGETDLSRTINIPNSTLDLTVKYTTSDPRQVEPDPIPANLLIAEQNENNGAAILLNYSWLGDAEVRDGVFLNNHADQWGGAIHTVYGAIGRGIHNSVFIGNNSDNVGGAIHNQEYIGGITDSMFIANSATNTGGVIYNLGGGGFNAYLGSIKNIAFISNHANYGGVIYNGAQIGDITNSTFINNSATNYGGAIFNYQGIIGNITNSAFIDNSANHGGAIYNYQGIIGNITNSTFINNGAATGNGGAVSSNAGGTIGDIINSTFINNSAARYSGAVYANAGSINSIQSSTFINNHAKWGGAVDVWGKDGSGYINEIKDSVFISNSAEETGGAILHEDDVAVIGNIQNSTFINNIAGTHGGAIYAQNDVNITSDGGTTLFQGNTDSTGSNAIYMDNASKTLTFDHKNGGSTYMYDAIDGAAGYDVVMKGADPTSDKMYLFNDIKNADVFIGNVELNTINNNIHMYNFDTLTLNNDFNMAVDVDLANKSIDRVYSDNYTLNDHKLNVTGMNLMTDATSNSTSILFADSNLKNNVVNQVSKLYSPIYQYDVNYNLEDGYYTFARSTGHGGSDVFNPAVLAEPAMAQANVMAAQNIVNNYAFHSVDTTSMANSHGRLSSRYLNRYAIAEQPIKDDLNTNNPLFIEPEHEGVWFKPFVTFENIPLRNGPNVRSTSYGALIGYDSKVFNHKHGWDGVWTGYVGYTGASSHYNGVDDISNGGLMGATYSLYKGGFFNATTLTAGAMHDQATTMYGKDNMTTLYAGVGNKTGYNWAFKEGLFVLQPSVLLSYTFANTFDYTNAAGVRIDSDPLHTIQISPGVKFFMNTKNGWQPYIGVNMMWNIMGNTHTRANGVKLPEMSVKPYVQYGIGLQKVVKDHFTAYGQAMIQNGGRNGISLTAGFKWCIGRDRKPHTVKTNGVRTVLK